VKRAAQAITLAGALLAAHAAAAEPEPPVRPAFAPRAAAAGADVASRAPASRPGAGGASAPAPTPRPMSVGAPVPAPATLSRRVAPAARAGDALCGDPRLTGARVPEVTGQGQCGIDQPVRLSAVAGVRLTRPVTVGCGVATALADWTEAVAKPAAQAHAGAALAAMTPFAGYACRPTNSQAGARISRHAMGQAVDIGAFTLADGREVTVLAGWRGRDAAFLRAAWRGACGPFGTVLGPDADRYHRNHLHFDTARYHSGPYCR